MAKKPKYSKLIGLTKSIKNVAITYGPAILLVVVNHYQEWMSPSTAQVIAPFMGIVAYYIKNYQSNK